MGGGNGIEILGSFVFFFLPPLLSVFYLFFEEQKKKDLSVYSFSSA